MNAIEITETGVARLQIALDRITNNPHEWNDDVHWHNGAGDLAAHVVIAAGWINRLYTVGASRVLGFPGPDSVRLNGMSYSVTEAAQYALSGKLWPVAYPRIFRPGNTIQKVWELSQEVAGGRLAVPAETA